MIFIKIGLMLWALVVLLLLLPFVLLEALIRRLSFREQLRKWAGYFPANGWTRRNLVAAWRWLGDDRLSLLLGGWLFWMSMVSIKLGNPWDAAIGTALAVPLVFFAWRDIGRKISKPDL